MIALSNNVLSIYLLAILSLFFEPVGRSFVFERSGLIDRTFEHSSELRHRAMGITLYDQRLESGVDLHFFHHLFHVGVRSEVLGSEAVPE